jgi:hypothetical protein
MSLSGQIRSCEAALHLGPGFIPKLMLDPIKPIGGVGRSPRTMLAASKGSSMALPVSIVHHANSAAPASVSFAYVRLSCRRWSRGAAAR